jgi:hypothetical protein
MKLARTLTETSYELGEGIRKFEVACELVG